MIRTNTNADPIPAHLRAPKHLSAEAKRRWGRIRTEYEIDDTSGVTILLALLEAFDRMCTARKLLKREGLTITDRFGHPKPHPAVQIERDARTQVFAGFRALKLEPFSMT
jgi:P27 family predicted phage terminase small subunit